MVKVSIIRRKISRRGQYIFINAVIKSKEKKTGEKWKSWLNVRFSFDTFVRSVLQAALLSRRLQELGSTSIIRVRLDRLDAEVLAEERDARMFFIEREVFIHKSIFTIQQAYHSSK